MCFATKCASCGKTTWAGCGKHVPSVYAKIARDQVCMCKDWPGVQFPKVEEPETDPKAAVSTATGTVPAAADTV